MRLRSFVFLFLAAFFSGCSQTSDIELFEHDSGAAVDIFYISSTDVIESVDSAGVEHFNAQLTPAELSAVQAEIDYIVDLFGDSFNVFSPIYHQATLNSFAADSLTLSASLAYAESEVRASFADYLRNHNHGRPFILMGFSQGAIHALTVLKSLNDNEMDRMIATYLLGYRIAAEDTLCSNVRPAQSADDLHVTVSFNSVVDSTGIFPLVAEGAVAAINPLNWSVSTDCASFVFAGDSLSAQLSTNDWLLYVSGLPEGKYSLPALERFCNSKCLHHADILLYMQSIKSNMLHRADLLRR